MADQFKETKAAFEIRKGRMYISAINTPDSPIYQERYRGRSTLVFAGVDHLELSVDEARALRDWLTSILPDSAGESR